MIIHVSAYIKFTCIYMYVYDIINIYNSKK